MADEIVSRAEARAKGLRRYFTGKPCKHGHVAARAVANGVCSDCVVEIERRYRAAHPDKLRGKWRAYEQNASPERREQRRQANKRWETKNPEKVATRVRRWHDANIDKRRVQSKRWRDANKEQVAEKNKRYKTEHAVRLAPIASARTKQWVKDNPEGERRLRHVRRARLAGSAGAHTTEELLALLESQNYLCVCGVSLKEKSIRTLDHIQPISRGGCNCIFNLQYLCKACNSRKHNKFPYVWRSEIAPTLALGDTNGIRRRKPRNRLQNRLHARQELRASRWHRSGSSQGSGSRRSELAEVGQAS